MGESPESVAWAESGAMALTGRALGPPLIAPDGVVRRAQGLGRGLGLDVLVLLSERAAVAGLGRRGDVSCGGAARLLLAGDGWLAVNLPRPDDADLIPAWLGVAPGADPWSAVAAAVRSRPRAELIDAAAVLGLAVAAVGETHGCDPVSARRVGDAAALAGAPLVVDLSSLWAGPLCGRLLRERGARVVKVESWARPDGARRGPAGLFSLMSAGSQSVALDFAAASGRDALRALVAAADVVIEASRPRALRQLGVDADAVLAAGGPRVWVSITGHGRASGRVAFGDDAAAAGGLVAWDERGPCFAADAVADPLSGVAAAGAVARALAEGGRWLLDVSMARVAAHVAGPDAGRRWAPGGPAPTPRPVAVTGVAPALGADNAAVAAELGIAIP